MVMKPFQKTVADSGLFKTVIVTDSTETATTADYRLESFLRIENPGSRIVEIGGALITGLSGFLIPSWDNYKIVNTITLRLQGVEDPVWTKTYEQKMIFMQWIVFVPAILYPPSWNGPANFKAIQRMYRDGMADLIHDFPAIASAEVK